MPTEFLNEKPFGHTSRWGTIFTAKRCDFVGGVVAQKRSGLTERKFAQDCMEMAGYHATVIHPQLNGFAGYGAFTLEVEITD